ncbi:hypothetical protein [Streptomyces sp. NPDC048489]|uniref:hypothetical protein n=1 Tax=Streptomyces sp. NPDC048489 TaxID=3154504 RepID=UPI00341AEB61
MAASVHARVLALAGDRRWIVVAGRMPRPAAPCLHDLLRARCGPSSVVFVDLRDAQLPVGERTGGLFLPAGPRAFHVVADGALHSLLAADRRVTPHPSVEQAWRAWCSA